MPSHLAMRQYAQRDSLQAANASERTLPFPLPLAAALSRGVQTCRVACLLVEQACALRVARRIVPTETRSSRSRSTIPAQQTGTGQRRRSLLHLLFAHLRSAICPAGRHQFPACSEAGAGANIPCTATNAPLFKPQAWHSIAVRNSRSDRRAAACEHLKRGSCLRLGHCELGTL